MSHHTEGRAPRLPRILVIDDSPDTWLLMTGLFEDRCEVLQAHSGREGLRFLTSANPPDMVLLDSMLPDVDGDEVLRRIRQHPPTANIPVLLLTALAKLQGEPAGPDCGPIDYLPRPLDPQMVVERVEARVVATARGRRMEALSAKLAGQIPPGEWETLFRGPGQDEIRFVQKQQTILYADSREAACLDARERESLAAEVEWLAMGHEGTVDRFSDAAAVICFNDPAAGVRMAMDLQRCAGHLQLRMGLHTGACDIAVFRCARTPRFTLLGDELAVVAGVAASAASGGIALTSQAYALVREDIHTDAPGCLLTEEFNHSGLAAVCLSPAPFLGEQALSTFAGIGH